MSGNIYILEYLYECRITGNVSWNIAFVDGSGLLKLIRGFLWQYAISEQQSATDRSSVVILAKERVVSNSLI